MANKTRETANLVSSKTGIAVTISGDPVILGVGNTERVRITGGGDVFINRTSQLSDAKLSVQADAGEPLIAAQMDTNTGISTVLQTYNASGLISSNISVDNANKSLILKASDTEVIRIKSDGKIGFGTDLTNASGITYSFVHPTAGSAGNAAILQVATHADSTLYLSLGTKEITAGSGGDGISYIRAGSSTSLNNTLIFETAVAGAETEQMRLDGTTSGITSVHIGDYANAVASSGFISKQHNSPWEMTISASRSSTTPRALIFNSHQTQEVARFTNDSSPYFRLSANCAGIQFNGDTDAVDTLDYYEEGSWTPDLRFDSSNTGITYSGSGANKYGTYTRIGNMVFCRFMFVLSSKGTATGDVRIYGLPFTVTDKLNGTSIEGEGGITYFDNKGAESGIPYIIPWEGTTYARMYRMFEGASADSSSGSEAIFENDSSVRGYFLYYAA